MSDSSRANRPSAALLSDCSLRTDTGYLASTSGKLEGVGAADAAEASFKSGLIEITISFLHHKPLPFSCRLWFPLFFVQPRKYYDAEVL